MARGAALGTSTKNDKAAAALDVAIVGAGFSGLYMLHKARELGLSARVFESGDDIGGTWYWNRYPGARCDTESMDYSFSFCDKLQQEWSWSERYASQPEILRYIHHIADRFDLRRDIQLNTRVESAVFDNVNNLWEIATDSGSRITARFCVMATGCLSVGQVPNFPGLEQFKGDWYHTGTWPRHEVNFSGKTVGVIGTGSSGVQSIPVIAQQAHHLYVFQRTPNFSIPAWNAPMDPEYERNLKDNYAEFRRVARESRRGYAIPVNERSALEAGPEERQREYEARWGRGGLHMLTAFNDLYTDQAANDTAADFVRNKIREIVEDPIVAERLLPHDHPIGMKRICVDTDYYETYNRDNVSLIDLRSSPIEEITASGIRTRDAAYALDSIVFATGFDAMTGALMNIDIRGAGGRTLQDHWAEGPRTYLGIAIEGFPNLFLITGPGSPSVLGNMIVSIEQHVDWISTCIDYLDEHGIDGIRATPEAEAGWVQHVDDVAHSTLYPQANSWYLGVNIPGKPKVFMPYVGGVGRYRQICDQVAAKGYEGFTFVDGSV